MSVAAFGLPPICQVLRFEGIDHIVCEVDMRSYNVRLFHAGADNKPFGSLTEFSARTAGQEPPVLFAMNAGMYHDDLSPVGLYVEEGREISPIVTGDGEGNFFLKPNGLFFIDRQGKPAILESGAYVAAGIEPDYATQSGPMLVIDGALHPRFETNGPSRYTRNGVGIRDGNTVVFAISLSEVSFGSFARLFRDRLGCQNALYFDGVVSAMSNGKETIVGGSYPTGPIVVVSAKSAPPS